MRADNSYTEAKKIIKGDYERARDRWICALICVSHGLDRNTKRVFQVATLMLLHTSRRKFQESGQLEAFPSLGRLAFMVGVSEKTVRRAIKELTEGGLLRVRPQFNKSNRYWLIIPSAAAEHSAMCLDLLTNPRHRPVQKGAKTSLPSVQGSGQMGTKTLPSVHLHSDYPLNDTRSLRGSIKESTRTKEKRLGEEVGNEGNPSPNPIFREARESFGQEVGSIVAKAMKDWGRDAQDVRNAIEAVSDFDGDARDLAHELWKPE